MKHYHILENSEIKIYIYVKKAQKNMKVSEKYVAIYSSDNTNNIVNLVYGTMALEEQKVSRRVIGRYYSKQKKRPTKKIDVIN